MASFREAAQNNLSVGTAFRDNAGVVYRNADGETTEEASRGQFRRGFDIGSANLKKGAYNSLRAFGDKSGFEGLSQFGAEGAERVGEGASALPSLAQPSITEVDDMSDVLDWALGGLGQVGPSLLATAGGAVAGAAAFAAAPVLGATAALGAGVGAFATSALPEMGHAYADIEDATGEKAFWTSLATGSAIGALDKLGFNRLIKAGVPQNTVRRMVTGEALDEAETLGIRNIATAMASEGLTEGVQEFVGNVGRQQGGMDIDPLSEEALNNYINAVALGALAGGTIGTAGSIVKAGASKTRGTLRDRAAAQEVANRSEAAPIEERELDAETAAEVRILSEEEQAFADYEAMAAEQDRYNIERDTGAPDGSTTIDQSRRINQLREAMDSGDLLARAYRAAGGENPKGFMESVDLAITLAEEIRDNPDRQVTPEEAEFIKAVFSYGPLQSFMPDVATDPNTDAIYDEAVETADVRDDGGYSEELAALQASDPNVDLEQTEDDLVHGEGFALNDSVGDATYESFGGGALQTKAAGIELALEKEQPTDVTGRKQQLEAERADNVANNIKKLNAANPEFVHEPVSLLEATRAAAAEQAKAKGLDAAATAKHIDRVVAARAARQHATLTAGGKTSAVASKYDESDPDAFLSKFSVVKKTKRSAAKGLEDGTYSADDLVLNDYTKDAKEGSTSKPNATKLLWKLAKNQKQARPGDGKMDVTVDGTPQQLSVINMVFKEISRGVQKTTDGYVTTKKNVEEAFLRGLGTLLTNDHKKIELGEMHGDTVLYRKGNEEITLADLSNDTRKKLAGLVRQHDRQMTQLLDTLNLAATDPKNAKMLKQFAQQNPEIAQYAKERSAAIGRAERNNAGKSDEDKQIAMRSAGLERRTRKGVDATSAISEAFDLLRSLKRIQKEAKRQDAIAENKARRKAETPEAAAARRAAAKEKEAIKEDMAATRARVKEEKALEKSGVIVEQPETKKAAASSRGKPEKVRKGSKVAPSLRNEKNQLNTEDTFNFNSEDTDRVTIPLSEQDGSYQAGAALRYLDKMQQEGSDLQWSMDYILNNILDPEWVAEYSKETDTDNLAFIRLMLAEQAKGTQDSFKPWMAAERLLEAMGVRTEPAAKNSESGKLEAAVQQLHKIMGEWAENRSDFKNWVKGKKGRVTGKTVLSEESLKRLEDNPLATQQRAVIRDAVKAWAKKTGDKAITFFDTREMVEQRPELHQQVLATLRGENFGFAFEYKDAKGNPQAGFYISPLIDTATAVEQAAHEFGHGVMYNIAHRMTEAQATQIIKDFEQWANQYDGSSSVADILTSKKTARAKLAALAGHTSQMQLQDLDPADANYMLDFNEWFADRIGSALIDSTRRVTKASEAKALFDSLTEQVNKLKAELKDADGDRARAISKILYGDYAARREPGAARVDSNSPVQDTGLMAKLASAEAAVRHNDRVAGGTAFQKYANAIKEKVSSLYDQKFSTQKDANEFLKVVTKAYENERQEHSVWDTLEMSGVKPRKIEYSTESGVTGDPMDAINNMVRRATGMSLRELLIENGKNEGEADGFIMRMNFSSVLNRAEAWSAANIETMGWVFDNATAQAEHNVLAREAMSPRVQIELHRLLRDDPDALNSLSHVEDGVKNSVAYMFMFARAGKLTLQPKPRGIMEKLFQLLAEWAGFVADTNQVKQIYDAMDQETMIQGHRTFVLRTALRDNVFRTSIQDLNEVRRKIGAKYNILNAASQVLIDTGNASLIQMTKFFDNTVGQVGNVGSFHEERTQRAAGYVNMFDAIMGDDSVKEIEAVRDLLRNYMEQHQTAEPAVKAKADKILLLFNELYEYYDASGLVGDGTKHADGTYKGMAKRGQTVTVKDANGNDVEVAAYFPWAIDPEKIVTAEGVAQFRELLNKPEYDAKMEEYRREMLTNARARLNRIPRTGETIDQVAAAQSDIDLLESAAGKQMVIDQLLSHLQQEYGTTDTDPDLNPDNLGHTPKMSNANPRAWAWMTELPGVTQEARDLWFGLQTDSLSGIMNGYIEQGVKRATYVKRFGKNGKVLEDLIIKARANGASDLDIHNAKKYINAQLGTHGAETYTNLVKIWNATGRALMNKPPLPLPKPGVPINPTFMKVQQWMMTYQNFRILDWAVLTSLMDPIGIFARTGDLSMMWDAFKFGVKDTFSRTVDKELHTELNSVATMLGIVEQDMKNDALQWQYSGNFMTGKARKANDAFFKYTGLQGWTRATRLMATRAATQFLKHHTSELARLRTTGEALIKRDNAGETLTPAEQRTMEQFRKSERYLLELGVRENDLTEDSFHEDGMINLMGPTEFAALEAAVNKHSENIGALAGDQGPLDMEVHEALMEKVRQYDRELRLRTAMIRFSNEAVLRPNASQRPIWASDPHFAVFFHLKQFIWSFHSRMLGRMGHEVMNGNAAPMVYSAAMFVLVMGASDALREYLKHGSEGSPFKQHWGFTDYAWNAVQRAGLTGVYQSLIDATGDRDYGGVGFESFSGPTVNQALRAIPALWNDQEYAMKQLDKALPFSNYRQSLDIMKFD